MGTDGNGRERSGTAANGRVSENVASGGNCVSQKTVKWLGRGSSYGKQTFGHQFNSRCGRFLACLLIVFLFLCVSCSPAGFCFACRPFPTVPVRSRPFPTEKYQNRKRRKATSGRSRPFPSVPYHSRPKTNQNRKRRKVICRERKRRAAASRKQKGAAERNKQEQQRRQKSCRQSLKHVCK